MRLSEDERRALTPYFDKQFYLVSNPDVLTAGVDALNHFHEFGWREGRDPSRDFNTRYYLTANPDVAEAGINPLLHYVWAGRGEGRPVRPSSAESSLILDVFDAAYYRSQYSDVEETGVDPLLHFCEKGWREGRNPSADFDTQYYLSANPDVAAASINPFIHYVIAGKAEGRLPRRQLHDERKEIEKAYQIAALIASQDDLANESAMWDTFNPAILATGRNLVVCVTHDNYRESRGGVQNIVGDEEEASIRSGWDFLCLYPIKPYPALTRSSSPNEVQLAVVFNGENLGRVTLKKLIQTLANIASSNIVKVVVHHLMGHMPEVVVDLVKAANDREPVFWIHDFFSICPNYALLRNGTTFCGGPHIESDACTICAYGRERLSHANRISKMFDSFSWLAVAPSEIAAVNFRRMSGLRTKRLEVWPPARIVWSEVRDVSAKRGRARVAFLGSRQFVKGWAIFRELVRLFGEDGRYEFFHLGLGDGSSSTSYITQIDVNVSRENRYAMVEAVRSNEIEIVIVWSLAAETFNFVVHEALAGGAFVAALKNEGNVWAAVQKAAPEQGMPFNDVKSLIESFRDGSIIERARSRELRYGHLSFDRPNGYSVIERAV